MLPISLFAGACALVVAVQHPPDFYAAAIKSLPPPQRRQALAQEVEKKREALLAAPANQPEWALELTEEQINSWFAERFGDTELEGLADISDPRLQIHPGLLQVGVKSREFNSVLSFDLRPTVTGPRQLTFKIEALRSGVVPLPISQIELPPTGDIEGDGWKLRWKHDPKQQTLILDWDAGQQGVLSDWKTIDLQEKHLAISGKLPETKPASIATQPAPASDTGSATEKKPDPENKPTAESAEKPAEPPAKQP
ncbi:MAG: hypothetical protein U0903_06400 [Planctomycetales bacterium]